MDGEWLKSELSYQRRGIKIRLYLRISLSLSPPTANQVFLQYPRTIKLIHPPKPAQPADMDTLHKIVREVELFCLCRVVDTLSIRILSVSWKRIG
jgi:hypothetical protein